MTVTDEPGDMVCGYKVIELIGEGGLSQLFKAAGCGRYYREIKISVFSV